jgi:hypothetical protein
MSLAVAPSIEPAPPAPGRPVRRARRRYVDSGQEAVVYLHRQGLLADATARRLLGRHTPAARA